MKTISTLLFSFILLMGCLDSNKNDSSGKYLHKGQQISAAVFSVLSAELQNAMEDGGVENALGYCNLNALNLVDSLSKIHHAKIRRTSVKYRNPEDRPVENEMAVIDAYQKEMDEGKELVPKVVQEQNGSYHFYALIFINDLCLKCHGKIGAELTQENADLIKKYYPNDLATGYSVGDFRGIWSIEFNK